MSESIHLLPPSVSNPPQDSILQPLLFHVRFHQTQPNGEFKHLNHRVTQVVKAQFRGQVNEEELITEVQIFSRTPHLAGYKLEGLRDLLE